MSDIKKCGYMGNVLRVNLSSGQVTADALDEAIVRNYVGGSGLGGYFLYDEVPPGVEWSDPENRFIVMSGPLNGTVGGSGGYSVVTKGPMNVPPVDHGGRLLGPIPDLPSERRRALVVLPGLPGIAAFVDGDSEASQGGTLERPIAGLARQGHTLHHRLPRLVEPTNGVVVDAQQSPSSGS